MHQKKKRIIGIMAPLLIILLCFGIVCIATAVIYSPTYLGRVLTHWDSHVTDYTYFPSRCIQVSDTPYTYEKQLDLQLASYQVRYQKGKREYQASLASFIEETDTSAFIIVRDDQIVYEQYANGSSEESMHTSFSMSKSVISLLIGKAIEEGYIQSIDQPISDYIDEYKGQPIGEVTIEELLSMRSCIVYEKKGLWFGDDTLTYWHPNLRKLALEHIAITKKYGGRFHYNNYHPLLLGIILERSTKKSVSTYFEETIWMPIGAQYQASWSLDSKASGFEKMESGINFRAIDFIKIGSMVLHHGNWHQSQIINSEWLRQSTTLAHSFFDEEYQNTFLENRQITYQYMWYSYPTHTGETDILAWGKSDQILYISPSHQTVILRTGISDGGVTNWEEILQTIASIR
ncbi:MAG: beta-lactamase family protein [Prevotella sp.]|nr:beta-lactamase family protein [Staphylococcus sp.]MCM1350293.1 beta-lactamase family protein [Prevotella sp.]